MKCANAQISFTSLVIILAIAAFAGTTNGAYAQAPVAPTPALSMAAPAPSTQNLKEVAPLNIPGAPPLATAGLDDLDADEAMDIPSTAPGLKPMDTMGGTMPASPSMKPVTAAGAGATPEGKNIPTAVTDIVTDLKRAEKNVTLEDVARAQDALARLDLLLDIEKKINEIEKVRDDRKSIGKSFSRDSVGSGGFGQIPASALSLPMGGGSPFRPSTPSVSQPKPQAPAPAAPRASADGYTVEQITGSNGRYRAIISDSGGKKSTVSTGEKLSGFTVSNISATGVTLTSGKDRKVLPVESNGIPMVVRPR